MIRVSATPPVHQHPTEKSPADWKWTIPLTKGYVALVSEEDYDRLARYKWQANTPAGQCYAVRTKYVGRQNKKDRKKTIKMHREIMNAEPGTYVDHINGDTLDNRRCNLRFATLRQNSQNKSMRHGSSKYKGVTWHKRNRSWVAQIGLGRSPGGRQNVLHIGCYKDEADAGLAYDRKAKELFGEFARLNFPGQDDGRELQTAQRPTKHRRGEDHQDAKLTAAQVYEIRRRADAGESCKAIASDFGVSDSLVRFIKRRKRWSHLPEVIDPQHKEEDSDQ